MPTFEEILAAKRAKAAALENKIATLEKQASVNMEEKTLPEELKREEPAFAVPKAMSFAEKMKLKKEAQQNGQPVASVAQSTENPAPSPVSAVTTVAAVQHESLPPEEKDKVLRTGVLDARMDKNPMPTPTPAPSALPGSTEEEVKNQQAYADIKEKIDFLNQKSGEDLVNAMSALKKALLANPNAVALMEDADIGQMTIAIRKITGETIVEATKEGTKKKKDKQIDLSDPAAVAAVLDSL